MCSKNSAGTVLRMPDIEAGMTIRSLFSTVPLDPLELRILLEYAIGFSRVKLITHSDHPLTTEQAKALSDVVSRRVCGEPIAYITGKREFFGLSFAVCPDVLIPRPETELLVELALERLPRGGKIVDMGTGSGAIAIAIASERPDAHVFATDVSEKALNMATHNALALLKGKQTVRFLAGSWFDALKKRNETFDLIVSNPPYIDSKDDHLQEGDLRFEPVGALTDHADGLSALKILVSGAPAYLKQGGWLLMEHGYDQAEAVRSLLARAGFEEVQSWKDLAGIGRVSGGKWK